VTDDASVSAEVLAEEMFQLITECMGKKKLKPGDLTKEMIAKHGPVYSKEDCKKAIRILVDSGRCIYSYLGGTYIELPPDPSAEPPA